MSVDDGLVMQIHPGSLPQPQSPACSRASAATRAPTSRPRTDYVARAEAAARSLRQRARAHGDPVHARRDRLCARTGAARRPLSGPEARPAVVVPRQPRGHAPLPRADDGDGRLLQHRRLQRRHARLPVDPGASRRRAAGGLRLPRARSSSSTGSARTRPSSSRRCSRTASRRPRTSSEGSLRGDAAGGAPARAPVSRRPRRRPDIDADSAPSCLRCAPRCRRLSRSARYSSGTVRYLSTSAGETGAARLPHDWRMYVTTAAISSFVSVCANGGMPNGRGFFFVAGG